jgi:CDP-glucose 4,6-dehydratase
MEDLVMEGLFGGIFRGRKVLLTGHSGFKGSWLLMWLTHLGAKVTGYSLAPASAPSHIQLLGLFDPSSVGDIRNNEQLTAVFKEVQPDIVFHLAAQPLVRKSYADPLETFHSNVLGTANVLEAARHSSSVKAIVNITTDKVYRNYEWPWPYRETDSLGGHDPYSTSKACVELVHESYRKSYFQEAGILSATARAGNVIGGGDWAEDRLIPDLVRASSKSRVTNIRNPGSVRPWQHVLDPLSGYLALGQHLLQGNSQAEGAWNFGPHPHDCLSVAGVLDEFNRNWEGIQWRDASENKGPHEAGTLRLDCSKAFHDLAWEPVWNVRTAIAKTAAWYKDYLFNQTIQSLDNLQEYIADASLSNINWAT